MAAHWRSVTDYLATCGRTRTNIRKETDYRKCQEKLIIKKEERGSKDRVKTEIDDSEAEHSNERRKAPGKNKRVTRYSCNKTGIIKN